MLSEYQYRVMVKVRGYDPFERRVPNEREAVAWAALERKEDPSASVTIERREVSPWEPYEPCE